MAKAKATNQTQEPEQEQPLPEMPFGEIPPGTPFRACNSNWWKSDDPQTPLLAIHETDREKDQEFFPQVKVNPPSPGFSTDRNPATQKPPADQVKQPEKQPETPPNPPQPKPPEPTATTPVTPPPNPPQPVTDPLAPK